MNHAIRIFITTVLALVISLSTGGELLFAAPPERPSPGAGLPGTADVQTDPNGGQTVGVFFDSAEAYPGYTLFAPIGSTTTYLIDNQGRLIHSWESEYRPGMSAYLLEDGSLLRTGNYAGGSTMDAGGAGGLVQKLAWGGAVTWEYRYADAGVRQHHDVEPMPNGNVLMIAWERKSFMEAQEEGRNPSLLEEEELWPDHLIEVDAETNEIVWEWHIWDHLIQDYDPSRANYGTVGEHPELIDVNFGEGGGADWTHINAVDYNPQLDQILLSAHNFNEIWIIDHSTTTAEAAGHSGGNGNRGGDLLYRWGNPAAYNSTGGQVLYGQHDAQWIEEGLSGAGNILIFNNGRGRWPEAHSSVEEITPPLDSGGNYTLSGPAFGPFDTAWHYEADNPGDFYSGSISGAQRLPNGNTLICEGESGAFFEVNPEGETVWRYVNPAVRSGAISQTQVPQGNSVFRARRYGDDYPGLANFDLTPGNPIETYISPYFDFALKRLYIPELLATGVGSCQATLELVGGNPITFDLLSAASIDETGANPAVYDPADGTLSMKALTVGDRQYSVTLKQTTGSSGNISFNLAAWE